MTKIASKQSRFLLVMLIALFTGLFFIPLASAQPGDIQGHWAEEQISDWFDKGLAKGYADGNFMPDNTITRAEFVALVNRAFGFSESGTTSFSDVSPDKWYVNDVAIASAAGYIAGYGDGTFQPDNNVTRQEAAVMVALILKLDTGDLAQADVFSDAGQIQQWSKGAIGAVYKEAIMRGYQDQSFGPANPITRAEAIVTLAGAMAYAPGTAETAKEPQETAGEIQGAVTLEGKGTKAVVQIFVADSYQLVEEVETDNNGFFQVELDPGSYDVTAATETEVAYGSGVRVGQGQVAKSDLELEEAAMVEGILHDKNGRPVKGSIVLFTTNPTFATTTNNSGEFTVAVIPHRSYTVRAYGPGEGEPGIVASKLDIGAAGAQGIGTLKAAFSVSSASSGGGGGGSGTSRVFAGGSGTISDPYQIATAAQLDRVRNYLDKHFILTANIDLSGYANWQPIGTFEPLADDPEGEMPDPAVAFTGTFDGNGKTISNLTINQPEGWAVGLFGCMIGEEGRPASIANLAVEKVEVTGYFLVGGVVGYQFADCILKNVSLNGGNNKVQGCIYVGGIVGGSVIGDGSAELRDCHAGADILVVGDDANSAGVLGGALERCSVFNCTATGTVTAAGDDCFALGGLLGGSFEGVEVRDSQADVVISAPGENNIMIGGLLGYTGTYGEQAPTQVTGCSANVTMEVSGSARRVGGLVGGSFYHEWYAEGRPVPGVYAIDGCETSGSITGGSEAIGSIAGYAYDSTVKNCTSTMTINGDSNPPQVGLSETAFAGGSGTESDPYQVATAEQLDRVRHYLDKNFILTDNIDLSGYANWQAIGTFAPLTDDPEDEETPNPLVAFTGTFDGNGKTISNLIINQPAGMAVGLFGCVVGEEGSLASIIDLTVENVDVTGAFLVGGVVGNNAPGCILERVRLTGTNTVRGNQMVGGITGGGFGDLIDCDATANVVVLGDFGNLAGVLGGGLEGCTVTGCTATGTVTAEGNGCFGLGGLAGCVYVSPSVENCSAEVTISAGENSLMIGGLLGFTGTYDEENPTIVSNCTATAYITAPASTSRIGGIVGGGFYLEEYKDYYPAPSMYKIVGCSTSGSITGGSEALGSIAGHAYNSTVENCTSDMTINGVPGGVPQVGQYESAFAGGSGTESDPYQIATAAQLDQVRNYLDQHFILTADIDLSGYANWEPIGIFQPASDDPENAENPDREVAFTGTFDGSGHTVSNVNVRQPSDLAVGLFGCAAGKEGNPSSIYDLTVTNVDVTGFYLAGGVVGLQYSGCTLENVILTGDNRVQGNQGVGGITGVSFGDIKNCRAEADIVVLGDGGGCGGVLLGGMEGASLLNCTATKGTVTAAGDDCFGLGGLAGAANDGVAVTNCHADRVVVTASGENNIAVGGLLGYTGTGDENAPTQVTGCSAKNVTIEVSNSTTRVGGLIGGNFYPEFYAYAVDGCETSGSITGGSEALGSIAGYAYNSTVENCTSTMTINGDNNPPQVGLSETAFAGGSGTESDPYQVATAEQLDRVRHYLDKNFILTDNIDLSGYANWEPIGTFLPLPDETPDPAAAFTGSFDGNGKTISNLTIEQPEGMAVALFGGVVGEEGSPVSIHDLTVENVDVTGYYLAGGVVGYQSGGCTLENVNLTGSNTVRGYQAVGGIAGGSRKSDFRNCKAKADIVVLNDVGGCGGVLAGGLEACSVSKCTATGKVTAEGDDCWGLGGLAGGALYEESVVANCYAAVSITAAGANNLMIGGLLGYAGTYGGATPSQVTDCSADATIMVSDSTSRVGGLVGGSFYHELYAAEIPTPTSYRITDCDTAGSITGGSEAIGSIAGYAYNSTVENCTSAMTINGDSNPPQVGLSETAFAGGSGTEEGLYQVVTAEQLAA